MTEPASTGPAPSRWRFAPGHAWALIGLTGLGGLLRYWNLATLPPGYWYDEAHKSLVALEILRGLRAPIYVTDASGLEAGYFWLLAGWFRLFGPSYFGSRALSALLGTLTIPLTYWAVLALYRGESPQRASRIALASAAVVSFLLWHVHWSRLGLETITVPLASAALLGLIASAWQRRSGWAFALAGAVLGLSQYSNPGARILPVQVALTFVILAPRARRAVIPFALALLAGAIVVYAPLGWFFLGNPEWFFGRLAFVSEHARAGGLSFYLASALKTLLSLNVSGDILPRHNLSGRPAFDPILSLWMFAGLVAMVRWRASWRAHLTCLAALGVNLLPMVFSDGAPGFGRTLGAVPALAVLPALGLAAAAEWGGRRPWLAGLIVVSVAASAAWNAYDYFWRYPRQPGLFDAFEAGLWRLNRAAAEAARTGTGYLILDEAALQHPTTRLTRELKQGDLRIVNGQVCTVYPETIAHPTVVAVLPRWLPIWQDQYPAAQVEPILHEPEPYEYAALLTLPPGAVGRDGSRPALATFDGQFDLVAFESPSEPVTAGASVPLRLTWRAVAPGGRRYTAFVHIVAAGNPFLGGSDAEPCQGWYPTSVWHAGEIIQTELALQLPPDLAPGRYDLAVGLYETDTGDRLPVTQPDAREPDRAFLATLTIQ